MRKRMKLLMRQTGVLLLICSLLFSGVDLTALAAEPNTSVTEEPASADQDTATPEEEAGGTISEEEEGQTEEQEKKEDPDKEAPKGPESSGGARRRSCRTGGYKEAGRDGGERGRITG